MRCLLALLFLIVGAQSVKWNNIRSRRLQVRERQHHFRLESHIVGGEVAERHQFPYQVGVTVDNTYLCGGSLISNTTVLTAAHCTYKYSVFEVHLAAQNIMDEGEVDRQIVMASHVVTHEDWSSSTLNNDIALVVLQSPVSGVGIEVVRLPSRALENATFVGETGRLTGWGKVSDDMILPNPELKFVDMTVTEDSACEIYGNIVFQPTIMLCLDTANGTANSCNGDSGGPLVIYESDGKPTQIGIVSYGNADGCESPKPVVFTQVNSYLDWLESNVGV